MKDFATLDFPTLFREAGVPIRGINAATTMKTEIEINRKYADYDAVVMDGVGHYLYMTRPDEFNRLLMQAVDDLTTAAAASKAGD
jgi:pimeloyl-ACP methyl ester carboxylesterase